ncbi:serine hydrolase domain-containing protein [Cellulomonas fengjieae]|uniref:Beta-lactamase family protein n=1 Tax=Cellulomonas fengjieae TaxID=2819978 RepID=A0ABS3SBE5_9CELL|nr:serine hydrolase domain-containing protein [Cellulomonas fengjieae]MBO3083077.1 beta-lactamase family protein [Cellulomonas fengjieae]QVI65554.1 beta-lactamase family protein [Cellulomonas fengjieae]
MSGPTTRRPQPTRLSALVMACTFAAGAALAVPAVAFAGPRGTPRADTVQQTLDHLVEVDGVPGALASVTDRRGRERNLVAGVGDLDTGRRVPVDGQVRAGSNTKTFVAAVVLQLVGEGAVDLDASVETYLPGVVRGPVDGHDITVRDLLQHTSGIGSYTNGPPFITDGAPTLTALEDWYVEPHELLALGLAQPATPAGEWSYSNTNYVLAGLLVQRVTQRPLGEVVTDRIIEPLGLTGTYVPERGERELRGKHPRGYHAEPAGSAPFEHTAIDPASSWGAGDVVSTPSDLNTFFRALLAGDVVRPAELEQMKATVPMDLPGLPAGMSYGLGLMSTELTCGGLAWGHGGIIPGYQTEGGVSERGDRGVMVATTTMHGALPAEAAADVSNRIVALVDTVLCA